MQSDFPSSDGLRWTDYLILSPGHLIPRPRPSSLLRVGFCDETWKRLHQGLGCRRDVCRAGFYWSGRINYGNVITAVQRLSVSERRLPTGINWPMLGHRKRRILRSLWTAISVQPVLESALMHRPTWQAHRKYGVRTGTTPRSQRIMKNWSKLLKNIFDSFFVQF